MYVRPISFGQGKIIGGDPDPDASIVQLTTAQILSIGAFVRDGRPFCTGTLIAPRVVLTAAHCNLRPCVWFKSGRDIDAPEAEARVEAVAVHPSYVRGVPGFDFALAYLDRAFPSEPIPVGDPPPPGEAIQTAGFGRTDANVIGNTQRRWLVEKVVEVSRTEFAVERHGPYGQCMGDSGGPAIKMQGSEPTLIGVVSHGDPNCTGVDFYERPDVAAAWMQTIMSGWKSPPPPAQCGTQLAGVGWLLGLVLVGAAVGMIVRKG